MNAKEAIEQIKTLLFGEVPPVPAPEVAPVALATEYKLADGTVCSIDKLEVGGAVLIEGVPASDGVLALEDGTSLTVSGGLISELVPKADAPEEAPADLGAAFKAEFAQFKTDFESHRQAFTQLNQDFAASQEENKLQKSALAQLVGVVETLSKVEVAQPAQEPVSFEKMTPLEKFRAVK